MSPKLPFFSKGDKGGIDFSSNREPISIGSLFIYIFVVIVFFVIILLRLFQLTIVKGEYYRNLAEGNRIREIMVEPQRGALIDRKGVVLVKNIAQNIHENEPRILSSRLYNEPEVMAPIIGYRQLADEIDFDTDSCLTKLKSGDKMGKKGVEKIYDCDLRGVSGKKLIEVDAQGRLLNTISYLPPIDGKEINLSADLYLQNKAYSLIKNHKAAVISLKPSTGEILILASSPSYNPQDFEDNNSETIKGYFLNNDLPMFNRALEGTYPPGSVFKLILATGALQEGLINTSTLIEDTGQIKAGPLEFGNWYFLEYGKKEGLVNIVKAIKRSNDIFFYKVGEKLGVQGIKRWAEKFGYGTVTGISLEEASGLIPSSFWKEETLKEQWYLGDTYNFSIGQGFLLVTPLQVAMATAPFANGGYYCKPKLIKVGTGSDLYLQESYGPDCKKLPVSKNVIDTVKEGMIEACSPGGTGYPFFDFQIDDGVIKEGSKEAILKKKIQVACKTGTAESHSSSKIPHAWFTAFAPAEKPEIVVTVLVEDAGQGSDVAAPIARDILKAYFERRE